MPTATLSKDKRYHHGDLREALVLAGESALAELPFQDVSLREIARRAGVSHAAPKHHFPTLADLLGEIAARGFERFVKLLSEAMDSAPDQSAEGRMMAMARYYLRFARESAAMYNLMFGVKGQTATGPRMATAGYTAWDQLEHAVAGLVGPGRAAAGTMLLWSTVHGLATLSAERRIPPHLSPDDIMEQVLRQMISGLTSDPTA